MRYKQVLLLLLVWLGNFSIQAQTQTLEEIFREGDVFLVDVRTPQEFASGSVGNAVNIPLIEIENQLDVFRNKKNIVLFCRSGRRSEIAKQILEKHEITSYNALTIENIRKIQQRLVPKTRKK